MIQTSASPAHRINGGEARAIDLAGEPINRSFNRKAKGLQARAGGAAVIDTDVLRVCSALPIGGQR